MSVINVKVAYIRPQYNNLKEWMADPNNVYIGRRGVVFIDGSRYPTIGSPFANPYKIGKDGIREEVSQKYEIYIRQLIKNNPSIKTELLNLKGANLGCWCAPESCHGDVLLKLIEEYTHTNV